MFNVPSAKLLNAVCETLTMIVELNLLQSLYTHTHIYSIYTHTHVYTHAYIERASSGVFERAIGLQKHSSGNCDALLYYIIQYLLRYGNSVSLWLSITILQMKNTINLT